MSIKGYPTEEKDEALGQKHATIEPVRQKQFGLSVASHVYAQNLGADAAEANSTTSLIIAAAHAARRGDIISFTTGNLAGLEFKVWKGKENASHTGSIMVAEVMPEAPGVGDQFKILRYKVPEVNSAGAFGFSVSPADIIDFLDTPLLEASSTNIPASASAPVSVVSSLAANCTKVRVADTTGKWIGVYADPGGTPALIFIINPGADNVHEVAIPNGTEIGLRNMENSAIAIGQVCLQFLA